MVVCGAVVVVGGEGWCRGRRCCASLLILVKTRRRDAQRRAVNAARSTLSDPIYAENHTMPQPANLGQHDDLLAALGGDAGKGALAELDRRLRRPVGAVLRFQVEAAERREHEAF